MSGWWAGCGSRIFAHHRPHIWPGRCASRARNHHPPQPGQNPHEMGRHKCSGAPEAGILHRISSRIFLEGSRALNPSFLIPLKTQTIQNAQFFEKKLTLQGTPQLEHPSLSLCGHTL